MYIGYYHYKITIFADDELRPGLTIYWPSCYYIAVVVVVAVAVIFFFFFYFLRERVCARPSTTLEFHQQKICSTMFFSSIFCSYVSSVQRHSIVFPSLDTSIVHDLIVQTESTQWKLPHVMLCYAHVYNIIFIYLILHIDGWMGMIVREAEFARFCGLWWWRWAIV